MAVRIVSSARKHGLSDQDIRHAYRMAVIDVPVHGQQGAPRLLIGPSRAGDMLELLVSDDGEERIFHAMSLRPKFYPYLQVIT